MAKKKTGFTPKIVWNSEKGVLLVIVILLFAFIISMPFIYKFSVDVKNGNLFKKNNEPDVSNTNNNNNNNTNNNNNQTTPEPTGQTMVCIYTDSTVGGNMTNTYTFYYTDDSLKNVKMVSKYDSSTDDYLNFIYSEQARFNAYKTLFESVSGFSSSASMSGSSLTGTILLDLSKVDAADLKIEDSSLSLDIDVMYNQDINEVRSLYTDKGYSCR